MCEYMVLSERVSVGMCVCGSVDSVVWEGVGVRVYGYVYVRVRASVWGECLRQCMWACVWEYVSGRWECVCGSV